MILIPYTSYGERDTLGLNVMECLEGIQSCLTSAQGTYAGYEEICNSFDEEEYKKALAQYQIDYEEWEKSKEDEEE